MKTLRQILAEAGPKDKIADSVAKAVYDWVFSSAPACREMDHYECHCSCAAVRNSVELRTTWWFKELEFLQWDESKWKRVSDRILAGGKTFGNRKINDLLEDVADFSINGHSLIKFRGRYIDPYLKSLRVRDSEIQNFGAYWEKLTK